MKVYLDNGATTMTDPQVSDTMAKYFTEVYGNASSLHSFGKSAKEALDISRRIIADSFNADSREIIFTSGGTESDNLAIKGVARALKDKGNHIITSKIEHPAVLNSCKSLEKEGFRITYLDVDENAFIDLNQLKESITAETILVTLMHANNEVGTIQPIRRIGQICKDNNIIFHTDAVQSYTKVDIDTKKIPVDLISISSHKIHGPKGVGALYIKKGTPLTKLSDGGSHEFDVRAGTENISGIVGFAKSVDLSTPEHIKLQNRLKDQLIDGIQRSIPDTVLNGPRDNRLCSNINISFRYIEGESLLMHLDMKEIAVSTGSACSSKKLEPSHVLLAMGIRPEHAHGSIRFTISRFTTKEEIDYTIDTLKPIVEKLRAISPLK
ncbi:MAG: cysteine desulfurase [Candidatus Aenigmarchaeota archaeon]|nr:cysteine desulfurase [Candidatus Aenigmarchaeota archaeon]